jgi:hypothetical protein
MRDKSDEYARFAEFCRRMARTTASTELRASWSELADRWLALAHAKDTGMPSSNGHAGSNGLDNPIKK